MPGTRHRGPHPLDAELFSSEKHQVLREATSDLSWLLGRQYPIVAALKIVGDKFMLQERQRLALRRCACSPRARDDRQEKRISSAQLRDRPLVIDGFNCIITLESALGGGAIFRGQDGAMRDLASVHGSYRRVSETQMAITQLHAVIEKAMPTSVTWYLDRPVSNSGRLAGMIRELTHNEVQLVFNPDRSVLEDVSWVVASSDAWVIDNCSTWYDLTSHGVEALPNSWCIDLSE